MRSRLRNPMCQNPIFENIKAYKKQRNRCTSLQRQCIKQHLAKITKIVITTNKEPILITNFGTLLSRYLQIKGFSKNE